MRHTSRVASCIGLAGLLVWCARAQALVQTIDATVEASVVQHLAEGVVNTDASFESLDETTSNLPLKAEGRLLQLDENQASVSAGYAFTQFSDPRASDSANPQEVGVEAVAFSFDAVANYDLANGATETRTITFTADEIGQPDGTALQVTSFFFLNGFILQWGDLVNAASPSSAEVTIRVKQTRSGDDAATIVLEASLSLSHNSDGTPVVVATGALTDDQVALGHSLSPIDLLGTTNLLVIPQLGIPYQYEAAVGEEFTLEAQVECRLDNRPFTGTAIGLGISPESFVSDLLDLLGEPVSAALSIPGLNSGPPLQAAKPLPMGETIVKVADPAGLSILTQPFCGMLGIESMLMGLLFPAACWCFAPRRRCK